MVHEDKGNVFLQTINTMLQNYFLLSKKYLVEKSAKLEMLVKIKKMQNLKEEI